jgi:hypothetical protein
MVSADQFTDLRKVLIEDHAIPLNGITDRPHVPFVMLQEVPHTSPTTCGDRGGLLPDMFIWGGFNLSHLSYDLRKKGSQFNVLFYRTFF